jgi:hypothetical protein
MRASWADIHTYIHTYMHAYIHTYIHTHRRHESFMEGIAPSRIEGLSLCARWSNALLVPLLLECPRFISHRRAWSVHPSIRARARVRTCSGRVCGCVGAYAAHTHARMLRTCTCTVCGAHKRARAHARHLVCDGHQRQPRCAAHRPHQHRPRRCVRVPLPRAAAEMRRGC